MNTFNQSSQTGAKRNVSLPVIIVAVLALLGAIGYLYRANFGTPSYIKVKHADSGAWMRQKATECGGDFSKLSPEDQKEINDMTMGRGAQVIKGLVSPPP